MSPTLPRTLKNLIAVTLLVTIALTPALWFSQGSFPVVPASSWIPPVLFPILGFLIVLGALLTLIEKNPSRLPLVISLILVAAALCNILRALPFYYMYALMLFALGAGVRRGQLAHVPNVFRLMLVSTYIWSGLLKINRSFVRDGFLYIADPLLQVLPDSVHWVFAILAVLVPFLEILFGIGLLFSKTERGCAWGLIAMHLFILAMFGPLGRNMNSSVWPWNLCMIALLWLLFVKHREPRSIAKLWNHSFFPQTVIFVVYLICPALNFIGYWPDYLSHSLYSYATPEAKVTLPHSLAPKLPASAREVAADLPDDRAQVDIILWSYRDLNAPPFPAMRVYRAAAVTLCRSLEWPTDLTLEVKGKPDWRTGLSESTTITCKELM